MAKLPIIGLAGNVGSGKDTAGAYLAKKYNAICIAQADPLKRYLMKLFDLNENQLWGSQADKEKSINFDKDKVLQNFYNLHDLNNDTEILGSVVPGMLQDAAFAKLKVWFNNLIKANSEYSPRYLCQTLGTEWGRKVSLDMWTDYGFEISLKLINGGYTYSRTKGLEPSDKLYDYVGVTDLRFRNEINKLNRNNCSTWKLFRKTKGAQNGVKNHSSESELTRIPNHFHDEAIDNNGTLRNLYYEIDSRMAVNYGDTRVWR